MEDSEVCPGREILDYEQNIEDLFQQHHELEASEDDQSPPVVNEEVANFDDGQEDTFEIFAKENFYEEGDKLSEFNLELNSLISSSDPSSVPEELAPTTPEKKSTSKAKEVKPKVSKKRTTKPKKVGRKKIETGMEQRKDVVLKKVLRKIRNYFWRDFQIYTEFPIKKRGKADDALLKDCLEIYVRKVFNLEPKPGMVRTLSNLMCGKETKQKENLIYQTLYRFSFTRFKKVTKNSSFRFLVSRYSESVDRETLTPDESIGLDMIISMSLKS
eukprot:CAMPEP_0197004396 /NCGR_PEP_ID=MMETSP1380-20130617/22119_1 /TAXON_ID=5936 /ORGANISM="Euplotes crassus, Strain CT5" /LENGTH=271 /DNA_ID=CAMNT_0042423165 /DNA_START=113 /DNA_END=928 /DNA_ORIENTATION=+